MKKNNTSQSRISSEEKPSFSFIQKAINNAKLECPKKYSIVTNSKTQSSTLSFLCEKEIKLFHLENKSNYQNEISVGSNTFISQIIQCPDERLLFGTKRKLLIQQKPNSDDFILIVELSDFSRFTNLFFDESTQLLYIVIDYILLFEYDMKLVESSHSKDIQNLIDNRKNIQNNTNNNSSWSVNRDENGNESKAKTVNGSKSEELNFLQYFREVLFIDESGKYAYRVAKNIALDKYGVIRFGMLLTYDIETMQFKPQDDNNTYNTTDDSEFALLENNTIKIFDRNSLICKKIIEPPIGRIKVFKYSLDGKFLLIALEDDIVYGIDLNERGGHFCLEGHKSYVNDFRMIKHIVSIDQNTISSIMHKSSFKEISYEEYLKVLVIEEKEEEEDANTINNNENRTNRKQENSPKRSYSMRNDSQIVYEIITIGDDGYIGLWKYVPEKTNPPLIIKKMSNRLWEDQDQFNLKEFNFPSPKIIHINQLFSSNDYNILSPIEFANVISRPLLSMHFISNSSLIIIYNSEKFKFKTIIKFLQLQIDSSKHFPINN